MAIDETKEVSRLVDLLTVPEFEPGTKFGFLGGEWTRRYFRGYLRGADSWPFRIVEQNPTTGSEYARMLKPGHHPHPGCDGSKAHQIFWVFDQTKPRQYVAVIIDRKWYDLEKGE